MLGQDTQSVLDLQNLGSVDLVLNGISVTDPSHSIAVQPIVPGTVIAPGASIPIKLTFAPASVGAISGQLVIGTNDPSGPTKLSLTGLGQSVAQDAAVALTGNNNLGGASTSGGSSEQDNIFTISNSGAAPLIVSAIQITDGAGDFSLTGLPANLSSSPITLAFGQSLSFGAVFHPKDAGLDRAAISIVTNDPNHPTTQVDVLGTGISPAKPAHWGNNYVALDTGAGPLLTKSDQAGNFNYFMPANTAYHLAIFDPVSGLIAEGYGKSGPSGTNIDLTENLVFAASQGPDTDFDGLPDDVEWAIGTNPNKADSVVPGIGNRAAGRPDLEQDSRGHHWSGRVARLAGGGGGDRAHRIADAIGEADRLHRHRHLRLGDCRRQQLPKACRARAGEAAGYRDRSRGRQRVGICRGRDRRGGPADRQRRRFDESAARSNDRHQRHSGPDHRRRRIRKRRHQARCIRSCHGPSAPEPGRRQRDHHGART